MEIVKRSRQSQSQTKSSLAGRARFWIKYAVF